MDTHSARLQRVREKRSRDFLTVIQDSIENPENRFDTSPRVAGEELVGKVALLLSKLDGNASGEDGSQYFAHVSAVSLHLSGKARNSIAKTTGVELPDEKALDRLINYVASLAAAVHEGRPNDWRLSMPEDDELAFQSNWHETTQLSYQDINQMLDLLQEQDFISGGFAKGIQLLFDQISPDEFEPKFAAILLAATRDRLEARAHARPGLSPLVNKVAGSRRNGKAGIHYTRLIAEEVKKRVHTEDATILSHSEVAVRKRFDSTIARELLALYQPQRSSLR